MLAFLFLYDSKTVASLYIYSRIVNIIKRITQNFRFLSNHKRNTKNIYTNLTKNDRQKLCYHVGYLSSVHLIWYFWNLYVTINFSFASGEHDFNLQIKTRNISINYVIISVDFQLFGFHIIKKG